MCVLLDIGRSLDRSTEIDVIHLHLTLAFNTACHSRLLLKLQIIFYGIAGSLLSWFTDYLSSHEQCVVVNGTSSSWQFCHFQSPQGSALGPILFIFYINNLPKWLRFSRIAMFADNTKCYKHYLSICSHLKSDLSTISNWASVNELSFQPKKYKNLGISCKCFSTEGANSINDVQLKTVYSIHDLDIYISKNLHWLYHANTIVAKSNKTLGFLWRTHAWNVPGTSLRMLFIALFRSTFTYTSQVWAMSSSGSIYLMNTLGGM